MTLDTTKLTKVKNAIVSKINNIISTHNSDSSAHSTLFNSKANSSHAHGNITSDGKVGTTSGKPLITTTSGQVTTGTFGTSSGQFAEGNHSHSNYLTSHQDISGKEDTSNKVSSWSSTTTDTHYPSEKLVKDSLDGKANSSHTHTKSQISDFPTSMTPSSHTHGNITNAGAIGSTSGKPIITTTSGKLTTGSFGSTAGTFAEGNHTHSNYLTSHQSLDSKTVTVEKQTTAETGYVATYIVKQNGTQVGEKINIPKDFLVKSASLKTCTTANNPLSGLAVNDPYLDFVVNTKDNDGTDEHIYINVKDLVDTYTAGTGLTLTNGAFSVNYGTTSTTACAGNDSRLSDARTPTSHTHGNITNDGKIGSASGKPIITTTDGKLTTGSFGSTSGTFCQGNDSRLSNARTPTSHTHGNITNAGAIGTASGKIITTTTNGVLQASDSITKSQISDFPTSMTPTSHTHTKSQITDFPTIPSGSSTATDIKMNGTQSAGSSSNFAKADHVHPADTSRVAIYQGTGSIGKFLKVNNNGYLACESVTIPSAYTHPTPSGLGGAKTSGLYKISTDADGHITGTASVVASDLPSHTHSYLDKSTADTYYQAINTVPTHSHPVYDNAKNITKTAQITDHIALPSGYTQLDCIKGTGAQYIDTGWKFANTYNVQIDCKFSIDNENGGSGGYPVVYGLQTASFSNWIYPFYINAMKFNLHLGGSSSIDFIDCNMTTIYDTSFIIKNGTWERTINGQTTTGSWAGSIDTADNLFLCGGSYGTNPINQFIGKIYGFKITVGGTVVKNYVPCRRESDGAVGMYDLVSSSFVASVSSNFVAGNVVDNLNTVAVLVTYTDNTTETLTLVKKTS